MQRHMAREQVVNTDKRTAKIQHVENNSAQNHLYDPFLDRTCRLQEMTLKQVSASLSEMTLTQVSAALSASVDSHFKISQSDEGGERGRQGGGAKGWWWGTGGGGGGEEGRNFILKN